MVNNSSAWLGFWDKNKRAMLRSLKRLGQGQMLGNRIKYYRAELTIMCEQLQQSLWHSLPQCGQRETPWGKGFERLNTRQHSLALQNSAIPRDLSGQLRLSATLACYQLSWFKVILNESMWKVVVKVNTQLNMRRHDAIKDVKSLSYWALHNPKKQIII